MLRTILVSGGLCLLAAFSVAEEAPVAQGALGDLQRLTLDRNSIAPVFSPNDGNLIAFSRDKYAGVYLMHMRRSLDASGRETLSVAATDTLDESTQSGFGFSWAGGGEHIVFRGEGDDGEQAKVFNVRTKEVTPLSEPAEEVSVPTAHSYGVFFTRGAQSTRLPLPGMRQSMADAPLIEDHDSRIGVDGETVNPSAEEPCWLPRLSPDGEKLSLECWSGLYVYVLKTKQRHAIGPGTNARWSADSGKLAYERTQDDGHMITASDIYLVNYDGSGKVLLTAEQAEIVRRPSLSPDGTRLAIDIDGDIYLADVVLE